MPRGGALHGIFGEMLEKLLRRVAGRGAHKGQGWVLRQYNDRGQPTGPHLRWHPGGGHHGDEPYWRVVGEHGDVGGVIR